MHPMIQLSKVCDKASKKASLFRVKRKNNTFSKYTRPPSPRRLPRFACTYHRNHKRSSFILPYEVSILRRVPPHTSSNNVQSCQRCGAQQSRTGSTCESPRGLYKLGAASPILPVASVTRPPHTQRTVLHLTPP